jgi:hypothetical protein
LIPLPDSLEKDLLLQLKCRPNAKPPTALGSTGNCEFLLVEGLSGGGRAAGLTKVVGNAAPASTSGLCWTGDGVAAIGDASKQGGSLYFLTQMVLSLELELWTK